MYLTTTQMHVLTRLVAVVLLLLGLIFEVLALPVCEIDRFKCFRDCCQKGTWFCNDSPQEERCQLCSLRQKQCGTIHVHENCLLYCEEYMRRNSTRTPALTSPPTSTELPQTFPELAAGASTGNQTAVTVMFALLGLILLGMCLYCVCKRYVPQSWMSWLKDRTSTFPPARRNRPGDTQSTNGEQASGNGEGTRQPLLTAPSSTNTDQASMDETQSQLVIANPSQIENVGGGETAVNELSEVPNRQRPTESADLVGREVGEEDLPSTPSSFRSTHGSLRSSRDSLGSTRRSLRSTRRSHDGESLSTGSTQTTVSVHAPPGASARPPSSGSDISNDDPQPSPLPRHSSSNQGSQPEPKLGATKGTPGCNTEHQGCCQNHRCSQTIHNNINITSGGHCSGCPGNGCGQGASPSGAQRVLFPDHDVSGPGSGAGQNVFAGPPSDPHGSSVHAGQDVQPPLPPPGHQQCRDQRLYTTPTPDAGNNYVVLAPTGLLADDRLMNIKRRPDDGPDMHAEDTPSVPQSSS